MSRKFTKGEWKRRTGVWSEQVESEEGDLIFEVSRLCKSKEEIEANLRLLITAPKLLFWLIESLAAIKMLRLELNKNSSSIEVVDYELENLRKIIKEAGYDLDE